MITVIGLVVALGGAIVGAAMPRSADVAENGKRDARADRDPVVLDSWGMAQTGLRSMARFFTAVDSAQRWYANTIMYDHWLRIGRCEQPGGGDGGVNWYADGWTSVGHFQGGLGISIGMWREHSAGFPSSALQATPEEQMAVATRIYQHYGPGAWGCK
jgi:hypothetical protein